MFSCLNKCQNLLIISSHNKNSLKVFLKLIDKIEVFHLHISVKALKKKKTFVSVLKSPHVNKIAQEQFQKFKFSYLLSIKSSNSNSYFLMYFLKKLKNTGFPDINIVQCSVFPNKIDVFNYSRVVNPDLIVKKKCLSEPEHYLNVLDIYGEKRNSDQ